MVEFVLVLPIILILLVTVADFGRLFATGIMVESAARDASEVAAQEYLRNPPAPIGSPIPTPGNTLYYQAIHDHATEVVCRELDGLPNAGASCSEIPIVVCVHDSADPNCAAITPSGVSVPTQCASLAPGALPSAAQAGGSEASRYVEVRVCYRFSTLFNIPGVAGIPLLFGDYFVERARVFTVADY